MRINQGQTYVSTVPSLKMRGGDFSELNRVIYDPITHQPYPGNIIPSGQFDPASRNIITQRDALRIARSLCCGTEENETWLPSMYHGTGIEKRHFALSSELIADVINGTKTTGSVFLPTGAPAGKEPPAK